MHFGPWLPLGEAAAQAPEQPGVVQARAAAIFAYTRGQSAMVYYACSRTGESLREYFTRCGHELLSQVESCGGCWIRFGEAEHPERELARLLNNFEGRFGSPPIGNAARGA